MKQIYIITIAFLLICSQSLKAQVPTCDSIVPFYQVNLTGNPSGTWTSPSHSRIGNCCGGTDLCTSFEVILDSQAVMLNFNIASGAIPSGALYYQINCEPAIAVGEPICITGPGPHNITFCKPGNNQNTYIISSIPAPIFPGDDSVRIGCSTNLPLAGLDTNSITWNSLYPGAPGDYNSYLSCTSCNNPVYTPPANAPPYVDYEICGNPVSFECGIVFTCDTLRIYNVTPLFAIVTPDSATLCLNGPGVLLTANASGGDGNYSYEWRDQSNNLVETNVSYQATTAGNYTLEIKDGLYSTLQCPPYILSITVSNTLPPVVDAGADQTICASSPTAYLSGNIQYANFAIWSGGLGTFNPGPGNLSTSYTPTPSEVSSGVVTLILTSIGAGGGCDNDTDTLLLFYPSHLTVEFLKNDVFCNGEANGSIDITVTGGMAPYTYSWSNGALVEDISGLTAGQYFITVTDANGCSTPQISILIDEPTELILSPTVQDIFCSGNPTGTIDLSVNGGTSPYTYNWSNGATNDNISGIPAGTYVVQVLDFNQCSESGTFTINQPEVMEGSLHSPILSNGHNISFYQGNDGNISSSVFGGTPPYQYLWSNGATSPGLNNLTAGTYSVVITDANGCSFSATITLDEPYELALPTGYSPNGDGMNDYFVVKGLNAYPDNKLTVYSRWGNQVFATENYANNWDGSTPAGGSLPDGTYFVILSINGDEITLNGFVDIRR